MRFQLLKVVLGDESTPICGEGFSDCTMEAEGKKKTIFGWFKQFL